MQAWPAVARPFTLQHATGMRHLAYRHQQAGTCAATRLTACQRLPACFVLADAVCVVPVPSCRRSLRKAWWQLVEDVQLAAEAAARQAEVHAWKTKGAAVKVGWDGVLQPPPALRHSRVQLQLLQGQSACSALA